MKKAICFTFIAALIAGCATTKSSSRPGVSNDRIQEQVILVESVNSTLDLNALNRMDTADAYKTANSYYKNGDYVNAITAYDFTCAKFQYIPACVRLASMFEKGQGITANRLIALDIYERSCYGGHDESCNDAKRLRK
ncbi:sel1 repeat family protein [Campylobacter corcagiensis]|uniref:beta-lactamase n=1 Tax=Campylobacter corcagiensis TaxID=1448857 RepID=A0A7M1LGD9_9BACT|nr:sel1 repeat family protein [Campylobacter corcagiensis]QKF64148.1 hypothetical protein CCORG_0261 [Campylobacter corcagiensis]QOQ87657.1 sel1 repeat family protein [Campylobacter corcagiensis]